MSSLIKIRKLLRINDQFKFDETIATKFGYIFLKEITIATERP